MTLNLPVSFSTNSVAFCLGGSEPDQSHSATQWIGHYVRLAVILTKPHSKLPISESRSPTHYIVFKWLRIMQEAILSVALLYSFW